ncbi:MAG TPA: hypothetical protein VFM10_10885 [Terriglobales bacterium]|jgi:hypothetical protein|nr:hypothetical protein [Terriglobales bacterium]
MHLEITRLISDNNLYAVTGDFGLGTRVVKSNELRQWLLGLRIGEPTIAIALSIKPDSSLIIEVPSTTRLDDDDEEAKAS